MQKLEKRASVLLWSIFLSMVVLIAFISINYQVSKNLKENIQINKFANLNNEKNFKINEALGSGKFENINLSNNEIIVFENGNYQIGLKKGEEIEIKFKESGEITINVLEGGPVESINGIISKTDSISGNIISIKNISGYSKIQIINENKFEKQYKKYKILKKVGDKLITKENSLIKIF